MAKKLRAVHYIHIFYTLFFFGGKNEVAGALLHRGCWWTLNLCSCQLVSSQILTSCQPNGVISGRFIVVLVCTELFCPKWTFPSEATQAVFPEERQLRQIALPNLITH